MNKERIVGAILFTVGVIIQFTPLEGGITGIISAMAIGAGFGALLIGKIDKSIFRS
ncbi:hypothetical protein [Formosa sp. L2A11]|uniref:hypothetical protein n=1 Tax=Formosa sp. L2A11 TaxID=2686363 RepID=UPI00131ACA1C|nr:hypothetical protein [Formosa sp. L2A11]